MIATVIDAILVLVVAEGLAVVAFAERVGLSRRDLLVTIAAGFFIMLALRLALGGAGDAPIALCLLLALVAHVLDLVVRWRDRR